MNAAYKSKVINTDLSSINKASTACIWIWIDTWKNTDTLKRLEPNQLDQSIKLVKSINKTNQNYKKFGKQTLQKTISNCWTPA